MSYEIDQPCEVRVSGRWVAGTVQELDAKGNPRVRLMGSQKLVRCGPGKVRTITPPVSPRRVLEEVEVHVTVPASELTPLQAAMVGAFVESAASRAQPKPSTPRSSAHLAFVRSRACAWCGRRTGVEASHHGARGTSIKASDYGAIPLCGGPEGCHTHHTNHHGLPKCSMDHDQLKTWFAEQALKVCAERLEGMRR